MSVWVMVEGFLGKGTGFGDVCEKWGKKSNMFGLLTGKSRRADAKITSTIAKNEREASHAVMISFS